MVLSALTVCLTLLALPAQVDARAQGTGEPSAASGLRGPDAHVRAVSDDKADKSDKAKPKADKGKKKKVIRLDAITVEGRLQKPQAFYILQRSTLNFDDLNRDQSFVPKVVQSVEKDPF